jgi:aminoglycoside N3'-acetyltransferase
MQVADGFMGLGDGSARIAEAVRTDFGALFAVLDRQLRNGAELDSRTRLHIVEARAAAERGIDVSSRLIDRLQAVPR